MQFAVAVAAAHRLTINVHVPFEGTIPGTDMAIPYNKVRANTRRLPKDRSSRLAIYCRSGRMSAIAAADLAGIGYTDIVELAGGMNAWAAAGRPLLTRSPGH